MKHFSLALVLLVMACGERTPLDGVPLDPDAAPRDGAPGRNPSFDASASVRADVPADSPGPDAVTTNAPCASLGLKGIDDVERLFIPQRCGTAMCHGPRSVFPPKNLDK